MRGRPQRLAGQIPAYLFLPIIGVLCLSLGRYNIAAAFAFAAGSLLYLYLISVFLPPPLRAMAEARRIAVALERLLRRADNILIVGHANPDLDFLGAAFGLAAFAAALGKEAKVVAAAPERLEEQLAAADIPREIICRRLISAAAARRLAGAASLLIVADTSKRFLVEFPELLARAGRITVFDHHPPAGGEITGAALTYFDPHASSTCEMVVGLLHCCPAVALTPGESTLLLAGIALDTKNFSIQTRAKTFAVAAYLRRLGADPLRVRDLLRDDLTNFAKRLEIMQNTEILPAGLAIGIYPEVTADARLIAAQAADYLLDIKGIVASFVLCPYPGGVLISARSLGEVDVQAVLGELGGGGHRMGAGAQLDGNSLETARKQLKTVLADFTKGGRCGGGNSQREREEPGEGRGQGESE